MVPSEFRRPSNNPNGRPRGLPDRRTMDVRHRLLKLGFKPEEVLAAVGNNNVPCGVCRGKGRTKYSLPPGSHAPECDKRYDPATGLCQCQEIGERTCQSCYGTLFEAVDPATRLKAAVEAMKYCAPQLRAVDHTGDAAPGSGRAQISVVFVDGSHRGERPGIAALEATIAAEEAIEATSEEVTPDDVE